jgi:hypothetical protein
MRRRSEPGEKATGEFSFGGVRLPRETCPIRCLPSEDFILVFTCSPINCSPVLRFGGCLIGVIPVKTGIHVFRLAIAVPATFPYFFLNKVNPYPKKSVFIKRKRPMSLGHRPL